MHSLYFNFIQTCPHGRQLTEYVIYQSLRHINHTLSSLLVKTAVTKAPVLNIQMHCECPCAAWKYVNMFFLKYVYVGIALVITFLFRVVKVSQHCKAFFY